MNLKIAFCAVVAAAFIGTGCETHHEHHHFSTKISKKEAGTIALSHVPGGTVRKKDTHLEKVDGRLLWDVSVNQPGAAGVTEVHLDANTGEVVHKG